MRETLQIPAIAGVDATLLGAINQRLRAISDAIAQFTGDRGPVSFTDDLDLGAKRVTNVGQPIKDTDVVTLGYLRAHTITAQAGTVAGPATPMVATRPIEARAGLRKRQRARIRHDVMNLEDVQDFVSVVAGPIAASYITVTNDATLPNERALAVAAGLSLVDAGANATITITPANDIGAIEALAGTGYARRTGVDTWILDAGTGGGVTAVGSGTGVTATPNPIVAAGTVDLDIFSLTTEPTPASGDWFPFVDVSVGTTPSSQRKVTLANLATAISALIGGTGGSGAMGPPGADGADGDPGEPGRPGDPGPRGLQGIQGNPGLDGDDGADGSPGLPGATGAAGAMGSPGSDGADGEPGDPGRPGDTGPRGLQGIQGNPGLDGEDGIDGSPGPPGATGAAGVNGAPGADGADGQDGNDGPPGLQGLPGVQGLQGMPGQDGEDGADGVMGPPGPNTIATRIPLTDAAVTVEPERYDWSATLPTVPDYRITTDSTVLVFAVDELDQITFETRARPGGQFDVVMHAVDPETNGGLKGRYQLAYLVT